MLPSISSSYSFIISENPERAAFIQTLNDWLMDGPYHERDARRIFNDQIIIAFDQALTEFAFKGNISSLPSSIGCVVNLQKLDLTGCRNLVSLPPEIGNLINLRLLIIENCNSLTSLPPEIGNLQALQKLYVTECRNFRSLPPQIGNLKNLEHLNLSSTSLTSLPAELGNLDNLKALYLFNCINLTSLPPEIGNLSNLQVLNLKACYRLTVLPLEMGHLPLDTKINIEDYTDSCYHVSLLPIQSLSLMDLFPVEHKTFIATFHRFIKLLIHEREFIEQESLITAPGASQPTHASGRFVTAFKDRMIAKRLKCMEQEHQKITNAFVYLQEDPAVSDLEKYDAHGAALPLTVLECFVAEDARVRCLWRQQEQDDRLDRAALASTQP